MTTESINIANIPKAALLAGLYNGAKPHQNFTEGRARPISDFRTLLETRAIEERLTGRKIEHFSINARLIKLDIGGDTLDPTLYDRDNGQGAAAAVVARLREEMGE